MPWRFMTFSLQVRVPEVPEELQKSIRPSVAMGFIILRVGINVIPLSLGERYSLRAPEPLPFGILPLRSCCIVSSARRKISLSTSLSHWKFLSRLPRGMKSLFFVSSRASFQGTATSEGVPDCIPAGDSSVYRKTLLPPAIMPWAHPNSVSFRVSFS